MNRTVNRFWSFAAPDLKADKPAELILYGDISSYSWWGDEMTPKMFSDELDALGDVSDITVRINSGGGDVFAATAIFTRLKSHKAKVTVMIDGWAASAATIVAMAGDVIKIPAAACFMIHDPAMGVMGYFNEDDFAKFADELVVTKNCIINAYAMKTGKSKDEIAALMAAETWYTGEEAVKAGFCDEILFDKSKTTALVTDFSRYKNTPKSFLNPTLQSKGAVKSMEIKNLDDLRAAYPELVKQVEDAAAASERKRIKDIEDMALPGFDGIVSRAKFEEPLNAADVAVRIVAEQKKLGGAYLKNRDEDAVESGLNKVAPEKTANPAGAVNPYAAAIDKLYPEKKEG